MSASAPAATAAAAAAAQPAQPHVFALSVSRAAMNGYERTFKVLSDQVSEMEQLKPLAQPYTPHEIDARADIYKTAEGTAEVAQALITRLNTTLSELLAAVSFPLRGNRAIQCKTLELVEAFDDQVLKAKADLTALQSNRDKLQERLASHATAKDSLEADVGSLCRTYLYDQGKRTNVWYRLTAWKTIIDEFIADQKSGATASAAAPAAAAAAAASGAAVEGSGSAPFQGSSTNAASDSASAAEGSAPKGGAKASNLPAVVGAPVGPAPVASGSAAAAAAATKTATPAAPAAGSAGAAAASSGGTAAVATKAATSAGSAAAVAAVSSASTAAPTKAATSAATAAGSAGAAAAAKPAATQNPSSFDEREQLPILQGHQVALEKLGQKKITAKNFDNAAKIVSLADIFLHMNGFPAGTTTSENYTKLWTQVWTSVEAFKKTLTSMEGPDKKHSKK